MVSARRLVPIIAIFALAGLALASFDSPSPLAFRWAQPGSASPVGSAQIDEGGAYVAVGGRAYAMDKATGNTLWRFPTGEPIQGAFRTGCTLSDGVMVAASDEGTVYGLDAKTGVQLWSFQSPGQPSTIPVVVGDNVVYGTSTSQLVALKLKTGVPLWAKPIEVKGGLQTRLGVWQKNLIYGTGGSTLNSINVVSQKVAFSIPFGSLSAGSFSIYGDRIFVNTATYVVAIRAQSGSGIWSTNIGDSLAESPGVSAEGVAVVTRLGKLFALDMKGKPKFKKGVELNAAPIGSPVYSGSKIICTNENGTINMVDSNTADVVWSVTIPPLYPGIRVAKATKGTGGGGVPGGGAPGGGRPGGGGGRPGGGGGPGGPPGSGGGLAGGGAAATDTEELKYVQATGTPVVSGNSLIVLARDGSVLVYDKDLGVDLTPPEVKLLWPSPGDQVSGKAPMDIVLRILDWGVGVNPDTLNVMISGKQYFGTLTRDGYLTIQINSATKNSPLADGRQKIEVTVSDWLGNKANVTFSLSIDNTLPALGSPKAKVATTGGAGGGTGNRGGGGAGGDGG